jgi:hypothetical protein
MHQNRLGETKISSIKNYRERQPSDSPTTSRHKNWPRVMTNIIPFLFDVSCLQEPNGGDILPGLRKLPENLCHFT